MVAMNLVLIETGCYTSLYQTCGDLGSDLGRFNMHKFKLSAIMLLLCLVAYPTFAATLTGHAYKADQTAHSGITITVEALPGVPALDLAGILVLLVIISAVVIRTRRWSWRVKMLAIIPVLSLAVAATGALLVQTITDGTGEWSITDLPPNMVRIEASAPGYYSEIIDAFEVVNGVNNAPDMILQPILTPTPDPSFTPVTTQTPAGSPTNTPGVTPTTEPTPSGTSTIIPTAEPTAAASQTPAPSPTGPAPPDLVLNPNPITYPRTCSETGWFTFTAALTSQPADTVHFNVDTSDVTEAVVSPSTLTFTQTDWATPQTVTVTGIDDVHTGNDTVNFLITYAGTWDLNDIHRNESFTVTLEDDDDTSGGPEPSRILILYNTNWTLDSDSNGIQDSLQVALYYAEKRNVPMNNLLGLAMPSGNNYYISTADGVTNWSTVFFPNVMQPIIDKLAVLGEENIDVFLMAYGMPLRIPTSSSNVSFDNYLMNFGYKSTVSTGSNNVYATTFSPYYHKNPTFSADKERFDHDLYKYSSRNVFMVSRLDGPGGTSNFEYGSLQSSMEIVDQAMYADKYLTTQAGPGQFTGIGYVDTRYSRYTDSVLAQHSDVHAGLYWDYDDCDKNIGWCERHLDEAGFDFGWENTSTSYRIGQAKALWTDNTPATHAPNALWYAGWYNYGTYIDAFDWLPGSFGCDLNSDSLNASRIRNTTGGSWGPTALYNGITCVAGVVAEPYTTGSPRSHTLLYYLLLRGYTYAEAAMLSCYHIGGWMEIYIGDPLYQPMRPGKDLGVADVTAPVIADGYPFVMDGPQSGDWTVAVMVKDDPNPEVVRVEVEYGPFATYGQTAQMTKDGYYRRNYVTLPDLIPNRIYHYRLILTDPVGNQTISGDYTFMTVMSAPVITSSPSLDAVTGQDYPYQAAATGAPSVLWKLTSAPAGMTIHQTTGHVSWTPTSTGVFNVTLRADNAAGYDTQNWSITVSDADTAGILQFSDTSYVGTESGTQASITVTRTGGSIGAVQADLQTSDGSAAEPGDYSSMSTLVSFGDGDSSDKIVIITIADDSDTEGPESFNVIMSNPTGGAVVAGGSAVVFITDNDPVNEAPVAEAGDPISVDWPSPAGLNGTADDDGLPSPPGTVTALWTQVDGPGSVSFDNDTDLNTDATFSVEGEYVLQLEVSDSVLTHSDEITITVNPEDTTPPVMETVTASYYDDRIYIVFSEPVAETSAETTSNYTLTGSISISNALLMADMQTVQLSVSTMTPDTEYTITLNNIEDRAFYPNTIAPDSQFTFVFTPHLCLVDFSGEVMYNAYYVEGWDALDKPDDLVYTYDGPGGVLCKNHNYQCVLGTGFPFDLEAGDQVAVVWYNRYNSAITFTPRLSFDDFDGEYFDDYHQYASGTWVDMSAITLSPGTAGITTYTLTAPLSVELVDVCSDYGYSDRLVCDRMSFVRNGAAFNQPPEASFLLDDNFAAAPVTINVDASASYDMDGALTGYDWDFSDGFGSGAITSHTYNSVGQYPVILTVTDDGGKMGSTSRIVQVLSSGPSTVWDAELQQGGTTWEAAYGNYSYDVTWRVLIRGEDITGSGSIIRLTLHGRPDLAFEPRRMSIAARDGETLDVVDSTYEQITFDGRSWESGVTVPANSTVFSDPIQLNIAPGTDLFITFFSHQKPAVCKHQAGETIAWITAVGNDQSGTIDWSGVSGLRTTQYMYAAGLIEAGD